MLGELSSGDPPTFEFFRQMAEPCDSPGYATCGSGLSREIPAKRRSPPFCTNLDTSSICFRLTGEMWMGSRCATRTWSYSIAGAKLQRARGTQRQTRRDRIAKGETPKAEPALSKCGVLRAAKCTPDGIEELPVAGRLAPGPAERSSAPKALFRHGRI